MGTFANSEHPDKMPQMQHFYQGMHCLLRHKSSSEKENINLFGNFNLWRPSIYNGPSWINCIKLYEMKTGLQRDKNGIFDTTLLLVYTRHDPP